MELQARDEGSIWLLDPQDAEAQGWLDENLSEPMMFGDAYVVEPRYVDAICEGFEEAGGIVNMKL